MYKRNQKGQFVKGFSYNKGVKMSIEARRKMSLAKTGIKLSPEHKLKLSLANKGKKYKPMSIEGRKNISLAQKGRKGRKWSMEERLKLSQSRKGDKWFTWKGGITPINEKIRKSIEYRIWRKSVFERDKWTCIWCGQTGVRLNADHIKPFALYPELRFAIDNGRTLCESCHRKTETYGNRKLQ